MEQIFGCKDPDPVMQSDENDDAIETEIDWEAMIATELEESPNLAEQNPWDAAGWDKKHWPVPWMGTFGPNFVWRWAGLQTLDQARIQAD